PSAAHFAVPQRPNKILITTQQQRVSRPASVPHSPRIGPTMSSFNLSTAQQAAAEFTARRPRRFHDLTPAKDVITELRRKGASFLSIAELLAQHGLVTSKSAIAGFCHEVLGEERRNRKPSRRCRKKSSRKLSPQSSPPTSGDTQSAAPLKSEPELP